MATYTFAIPMKLLPAYYGATLEVQLVNLDGSANGSPITTGFTDNGNGLVTWVYASMDANFNGFGNLQLHSTHAILGQFRVQPSDAATGGGGGGTGNIPVNQNTGGANNMLVEVSGVPQSGVTVVAYLQSDYAAGNVGASHIKGEAVTDTNGNWVAPIMLAAGMYAFTFNLSGYTFPPVQNLAVS